MRLDKFLSSTGTMTRTEASKAAKKGAITVDGVPVSKCDAHIDPNTQIVAVNGEVVEYREFTYIMLNKPQGYVSATDDPDETTVLELLPEKYKKTGLFPCGRLDKDTTGLLILTDDGQLAHRLLSPKRHVAKVYRFKTADPISREDELEAGVTLEDGYHTLPAKLERLDEKEGLITISEGKYHQIKRMFAAVGNRITMLERIKFGGIELDRKLKKGMWRYLSPEEELKLKSGGSGRDDGVSEDNAPDGQSNEESEE